MSNLNITQYKKKVKDLREKWIAAKVSKEGELFEAFKAGIDAAEIETDYELHKFSDKETRSLFEKWLESFKKEK